MKNTLNNIFSKPKNVIVISIIIGVIISLLAIIYSNVFYADAVIYSNQAYAYKINNLQQMMAPGLPPFFPVLAGILCRFGISTYYAPLFISCSFYIFTIIPLYQLLKYFVKRDHAAWGCFLYICCKQYSIFSVLYSI